LEDRILDAAVALFGKQHYHEVRMDDIAAGAKVGKGTLYRYFADKDALFNALIERASRQYMTALHAEETATGTPRERLRRVVEMVLAFWDQRPQMLNLIQRSEVVRGSFPWAEERGATIHLFHQLMTEGTQRGDFVVAHPETAAMMLAGGLRLLVLYGTQPRSPDLAERAIQLVLRSQDVVSA
jgi:AcrR family transcriptional regulator